MVGTLFFDAEVGSSSWRWKRKDKIMVEEEDRTAQPGIQAVRGG